MRAVIWPSWPLVKLILRLSGRVPQTGGALKPAFHPERAGVAHRDVGAHGTGLQPDTPFILGLQPQRKVGIGKCESLLHLAEFEVDAPGRGLHVGEARPRLRTGFRSRRGRNLRSALHQFFEVPVAIGAAHQVQAGIIQGQCADFQSPSPKANSSEDTR